MTSFLLACSGPGAMRVIQDNILYAQQHAMVVGAIAVLSIVLWGMLLRLSCLPITVVLLLLAHPAWTISALKGDCGAFKASAATFVTAMAALCGGVQLLVWLWSAVRRGVPAGGHR